MRQGVDGANMDHAFAIGMQMHLRNSYERQTRTDLSYHDPDIDILQSVKSSKHSGLGFFSTFEVGGFFHACGSLDLIPQRSLPPYEIHLVVVAPEWRVRAGW
jgi:hypothetical protein